MYVFILGLVVMFVEDMIFHFDHLIDIGLKLELSNGNIFKHNSLN